MKSKPWLLAIMFLFSLNLILFNSEKANAQPRGGIRRCTVAATGTAGAVGTRLVSVVHLSRGAQRCRLSRVPANGHRLHVEH